MLLSSKLVKKTSFKFNMLTWMHRCSVLQFPYTHWVWNSFCHILDLFEAKPRSHARTRLTFLLWPQAWFASWSRLSPSLSLSRLMLKRFHPSEHALSWFWSVTWLSHGFEVWHDSQGFSHGLSRLLCIICKLSLSIIQLKAHRVRYFETCSHLYRFNFSARQAKRSFFSGKLGDTVALSGSNILSRLNISPRESAAHTHMSTWGLVLKHNLKKSNHSSSTCRQNLYDRVLIF